MARTNPFDKPFGPSYGNRHAPTNPVDSGRSTPGWGSRRVSEARGRYSAARRFPSGSFASQREAPIPRAASAQAAYGFQRGSASDRAACLRGRKPEVKYLDATVASFTVGTTGTLKLLSAVAQGITASTRTGRKCTLTSIQLRGKINQKASLGKLQMNWTVMYLVHDTQPNKAAPAVTDILAAADVNQHRNLDQARRFNILATNRFTMYTRGAAIGGDGTTFENAMQIRPFEMNVKCCIPLDFDESVDTDGTIASQTLNSVYLLSISETANFTEVDYVSRLRFVD